MNNIKKNSHQRILNIRIFQIEMDGYLVYTKRTETSYAAKALAFLDKHAKSFIEDTPENQTFIANPDAPEEHKPEWHQFGIITHTKHFLFHFNDTLPKYLKKWGLHQKVVNHLNDEIDGISRYELIKLSIVFHDIGKFAGRFFKHKNGSKCAYYNGHERLSENMIRENPDIQYFFSSLGIVHSQIEYIARCAGLHYELGKIRDVACHNGCFNIAYVQSQECLNYCIATMNSNPNYAIEMGLLYLCDSLAKTDINFDAINDEDIKQNYCQILNMVEQNGLNLNLAKVIVQQPINVAFVRAYLSNISWS